MDETLPDSGGAYYDSDTGGLVGIARRNIGGATAAVKSGDAGGRAVAVAIGLVALPAAKFVADAFGVR